ncbi:Zinc knuckle CX2CX4HX4C [Parasponia andersonii]|uniref:Zinc knuckle CX2CX4HX4C n=1 Tax=Parasponia andersonii TaxID=3476 RepID=A0A2P5DZ25_PARAD|nr:Zinc knuckle CX2CX4HX4C [Parasponia andersonii]
MTWVQLKYERLTNFCYKCDMIGHLSMSCRELKNTMTESLDGKEYAVYGPWLEEKCEIPDYFYQRNLSPSNPASSHKIFVTSESETCHSRTNPKGWSELKLDDNRCKCLQIY